MSRFRTTRSGVGGVYQAGLDVRTRGEPRAFETTRGPYRGVVVETYVSDSEGLSEIGFGVEADVVLVRSGVRLSRVPVMARWGVNDAQPWVPRKTTRTLSDNQPLNIDAVVSRRGSFVGLATVLDDVDGDVVLVDFIEGDFRFPVVRGPYPHRFSYRSVIEGEGWVEGNNGSERGTPHDREFYLRHAGAEVRINDAGDVLIDTVGATDDKVDEDPASGRGQIRIRVKDSEHFTVEMDGTDVLEVWKDGSQVRIDLGEGAAQRLILGDDFRSFINGFLSNEFKNHQHDGGTLTSTDNGVTITGQTGGVAAVAVPPIVPPPEFTTIQMGEDLLSDLAKTKKS